MTSVAHRTYGALAVAVVVGALVVGFLFVGSPERRRLQKMDERRVEDLQRVVREIQGLVYDSERPGVLKRALPEDLEAVKKAARYWEISLVDPETGEPYAYTVTSPTSYELCATFALRRDKRTGVFWNHPPGRHCFRIDALDAP